MLRTADQLKIKGLCEVSEDKDPQPIEELESSVSPRIVSKFRRFPTKRPRSLENIRRHEKTIKLADPDDENDTPIVVDETTEEKPGQTNMTGHSLLPAQALFPQLCVDSEEFPPEPPGPAATPVRHVEMNHECSPPRTFLSNTDSSQRGELIETSLGHEPIVKIKLETLKGSDHGDSIDMDSHMSSHSMGSHGSEDEQGMHTMMITPELMGLIPTSSLNSGKNNYVTSFLNAGYIVCRLINLTLI